MELFCTLEVEAEPHRLGLVRHAVEVWLTAVRWPRGATSPIVFAVSEIVSNSIEHAYPIEPPGPVRIALAVEVVSPGCERIRVVVSDRGRWRTAGPEPGRGNGLPLVETLCPAVEVVTGAEGTRLTLLSEPVARGDRP
ncbi:MULTISPECIES: ATP-binding protein [Pseudonocardia]|uniref:ATP-binding protein n=1 Tax=Pseudonocardia TaxID=1847 RepID=UPI000CD18356|nr:ATP-binding protein [Pseudonocardia dioxanivorans]GJF04739.1 anti-sigma regulatory factor [Pseudonocardia sp. D17]